jgi:enamine deaminase RidA (YjgF/YER057c/UK114 family)
MLSELSTGTPIARLEKLYDSLVSLQASVQAVLADVSTLLQQAGTKLPDVADVGFLAREIAKTFDNLRKEADARAALAGQVVAVTLTERSLTDPNTAMTIRGRLASATPDVKIEAILPSPKSPEYVQFMQFIGVPLTLIESGLVKPDWPRVQELCNALQQDGKKLPTGIGRTYPRFHAVFRRRRNET